MNVGENVKMNKRLIVYQLKSESSLLCSIIVAKPDKEGVTQIQPLDF